MERRETGPLGAFPLRVPVGKLVAFCLALGFAPLWWTVGQGQNAPLQRFYEGAYWSSLKDSYRVSPDGQPFLVEYDLAVLDVDQGESLATVADTPG